MNFARMGFSSSLIYTTGVSVDLMQSIFKLMPADSRFVGLSVDHMKSVCYLHFMSSQFAICAPGQEIPIIMPWFKTNYSNGFSTTVVEKIDFGDAIPATSAIQTTHSSCGNHIWTKYTGISETYEFCTCCGVKKT